MFKMDIIKKGLINLKCDKMWLENNRIPFFKKIKFLFDKYLSIGLNQRHINYLGKNFNYDNRFSPVILQNYPKEVEDLDKTVNLSKVKTILDIGANIGQWSFTIKSFFPHVKIYSFEPNDKIFSMLSSNRSSFDKNKWVILPYAVSSKDGEKKFYFSKSASPEGSFYKENMSQNYVRADVQETRVKTISLTKKNLQKLKIPHTVDLVKIDVEGAEMEALQGLKNTSFKYLEIEVVRNREVGVSVEQVKKYFEKKGIKVKLLHTDFFNKDSPAGNAIFEIINK